MPSRITDIEDSVKLKADHWIQSNHNFFYTVLVEIEDGTATSENSLAVLRS